MEHRVKVYRRRKTRHGHRDIEVPQLLRYIDAPDPQRAADIAADELRDEGIEFHYVVAEPTRPAGLQVPSRGLIPRINPPSSNAIKLFEDFHSFEAREVGAFPSRFRIPREAHYAGDGNYVLYRSDKLNPTTGIDEGTIDYIHEHNDGVKIYRTDANFSGPVRRVPKWIHETKSLVLLGTCLGFGYVDADGYDVEAEPTGKKPELYTVPSGKALLVVQDKRRVLALIWGGKLGVEARGIVN